MQGDSDNRRKPFQDMLTKVLVFTTRFCVSYTILKCTLFYIHSFASLKFVAPSWLIDCFPFFSNGVWWKLTAWCYMTSCTGYTWLVSSMWGAGLLHSSYVSGMFLNPGSRTRELTHNSLVSRPHPKNWEGPGDEATPTRLPGGDDWHVLGWWYQNGQHPKIVHSLSEQVQGSQNGPPFPRSILSLILGQLSRAEGKKEELGPQRKWGQVQCEERRQLKTLASMVQKTLLSLTSLVWVYYIYYGHSRAAYCYV